MARRCRQGSCLVDEVEIDPLGYRVHVNEGEIGMLVCCVHHGVEIHHVVEIEGVVAVD